MKAGVFTDATKAAVLSRAKGRCELCAAPSNLWHFHHRQPRSMGGTSLDRSASPVNALLLHPRCHDEVERSRAYAVERGWIVPHPLDPAFMPVKLWDGWFLLLDDGSLRAASPGYLGGK